jgi:UDP-glucose 4-epimerase
VATADSIAAQSAMAKSVIRWPNVENSTPVDRGVVKISKFEKTFSANGKINAPLAPMNVLVVGAAGFIGSHLVKKLVAMGNRVVGIDVDGTRARKVLDRNVTFYPYDFGTQFSMADLLRKENVEVIVQCAGNSIVEKSVLDPIGCYTNGVLGNVFLMDVVLRSSVKKFVYVSSASVYGEADRMPITDVTVRVPISPLGETQLFVENMLESLRISKGLCYAIVRASNVAGLGEAENDYFVKNLGHGLIPDTMRQIIGEIKAVNVFGTTYGTVDSTAERDYIHVDDFCNACAIVATKPAARGEGASYNVGSGKQSSVREVIAAAEKAFGVKIATMDCPQRVGDPSRLYFDTTRTRNELNWSPKYVTIGQIMDTLLHYHLGKQKAAVVR